MSTTQSHDGRPVAPVAVGAILAGVLESRGWTQADLAAILDRPIQFVSEIVTGKKEITRESAAQIGAALGTSPEFWLNLQDAYLLNQQGQSSETQQKLDDVRRRARLNKQGPINLLRKRGELRGHTLDELEAEVIELFELPSLDDAPSFACAARRSNDDEDLSPAQNAWVACVRRVVRTGSAVKNYEPKNLEMLGSELPRLLTSPERFENLPVFFAEAGVHLVYKEAIPGAKIDGCAMYVDETPVIGISGRGKRLDKVLFTLLHEVAHLVLGHVGHDAYVIEEIHDAESAVDEGENEIAANAQAANWLLPKGLPAPPARISAPWVARLAAENGLAPIVIVGQLQKRGILEWRTSLARKAPSVEDALTTW